MTNMLPLPNQETLFLFYQITISIAGVLLPVFQAVLFFIVEKSFSKFEHSRQELVKFYRLAGRLVSASLLLLVLLPISELLGFSFFSMLLILFFALNFVFVRIALFYETGLWTTINSTKFIPNNFNKVRKYWRTCKNNNLSEWLSFILGIVFVIVLPTYIYVSNDCNYSAYLAFYLILTNLVYSLLTVSNLLNNPTHIQQQVLKSEHKLEKEEEIWDQGKMDIESSKLDRIFTQTSTFSKTDATEPKGHFHYFVNPELKNTGLLWCNIIVSDIQIASINELKESVLDVTRTMLLEFIEWRTDINKIALSWHFKLDNKTKNIFVRTDRDEVEDLKDIKSSIVFWNKMKNTIIDDILSE